MEGEKSASIKNAEIISKAPVEIEKALGYLDEDRLFDAIDALTTYHRDPRMTPEQVGLMHDKATSLLRDIDSIKGRVGEFIQYYSDIISDKRYYKSNKDEG